MNWKLEKYYFDLQTADGTVLIGYRGGFGCRSPRLPYEAWLIKRPGQKAICRQTMRGGRISEDHQSLNWANPHLGIVGRWPRSGREAPGLRLETGAGHIDWRVNGLAVPATVELGDGTAFSGLGYWEKLEMTLPPWRLPFPELRWGRFLADDGPKALVWVAWLGGERDERRVWSADGELNGLEFFDDGLRHDDGRLDFISSEAVRQGPLFRTLWGAGSVLSRLLPGGLGQAHEAKWFSRAKWFSPGGPAEGWAVHETVHWR